MEQREASWDPRERSAERATLGANASSSEASRRQVREKGGAEEGID
jgi:hypothetical protein